MNIDRPMASIFFQIKRSMPFDVRDDMKLSSPDIGERLVYLYKHSNNQAIKAMIEDFMSRAGDEWKSQLNLSPKNKLVDAIRRRIRH